MTEQGLGEALFLLVIETELDGIITVLAAWVFTCRTRFGPQRTTVTGMAAPLAS